MIKSYSFVFQKRHVLLVLTQLSTLHNKYLGLPIELEDSFAPFLFIMNKDLCVKYLHIHNKALPQLTLIYLEEIKKQAGTTSNLRVTS